MAGAAGYYQKGLRPRRGAASSRINIISPEKHVLSEVEARFGLPLSSTV